MHVDITESYTNASKRLIMLDYDGTLADIVDHPWDAVPTKRILEVLSRLASDGRNTVVIISGRPHQVLDEWLGHLPVAFAAEHGMLYKQPGGSWEVTQPIDNAWKEPCRGLMQSYCDTFDTSFIEEKTNGLVWHYRTVSDQAAAEEAAQALALELQDLANSSSLRIMRGAKIVEVQPLGVNKGIGAAYWISRQAWNFILIGGDDTTDEDMFAAAPASAYTIKVGAGDTLARQQVNTPGDMLSLLERLASA